MNTISKYYISKHLYRLHCAFCEMANCYVTGVAKALHSCKIYGGFKIIVRARLSYGFRSWRAATFVPGYQTDVRFVDFQIKPRSTSKVIPPVSTIDEKSLLSRVIHDRRRAIFHAKAVSHRVSNLAFGTLDEHTLYSHMEMDLTTNSAYNIIRRGESLV